MFRSVAAILYIFASVNMIPVVARADEGPVVARADEGPVVARADEAASGRAMNTQATAGNGLGLGATLHRFQDDFALGALVSTPTFVNGLFRFTAGGGVAFFGHDVAADGSQRWTPYGHARFVLETGYHLHGAPIRLYAFGGPQLLFLPSRLSNDAVSVGGVGGMGFEFFFNNAEREKNASYFIELGGIGSGAIASSLPGRPSVGNGFLATVGFRFFP